MAIKLHGPDIEDCMCSWDDSIAEDCILACSCCGAPPGELCKKSVDLGVHLSHCNFGEHRGSCKYGPSEECPALTNEWSWFGANLQEAERLRVKNMLVEKAAWELIQEIDQGLQEHSVRLSGVVVDSIDVLEKTLRDHRQMAKEEMDR